MNNMALLTWYSVMIPSPLIAAGFSTVTGALRRAVDEWGFSYFQADGLACGDTTTWTEPCDVTYQRAIVLLRAIVPPRDGYLTTCGNHQWLAAGLTDGQRLGRPVQGGGFAELYPILRTWARRYFTNRNFWIGDPGLLHVDLPTEAQSQVWASFVAMSGGATIAGDNLARLSPARLDILKKTLPALGLTARPCDLFEPPVGWSPKFPRIWRIRVSKPRVGTWDVVGLYNWTTDVQQNQVSWRGEPQNLVLDFARHLELDPAKRYVVYDFWRQQYLGAFARELRVGLEPSSCRVLVIHEETRNPQLLGDDRLVVSGAEAWRQIRWDPERMILAGQIQTTRGIVYSLAIHVPRQWMPATAIANGQAVPIQTPDRGACAISFNTGSTGQVDWSVQFKRSTAAPESTADSRLNYIPVPAPDASLPEITLRQLRPSWTDQGHDSEGGSIALNEQSDVGTVAPFWICWDISRYSSNHPILLADLGVVGEGRIAGEVVGDGRRLFLSQPLPKGQTIPIRVAVGGLRELLLVCHDVDGGNNAARGVFRHPRLTR